MPELHAVLFDLDGVLVDSHYLHYKSWQQLADELGLHFNQQLGDAFRGMAREECLRVMFEEFNHTAAPERSTIDTLTDRKNQCYLEILSLAQPDELILPGALELLQALRSEDVCIIIASGSKNANQVVDQARIRNYVDAVVDRHDVVKTKPDPAIFLAGLERARTTAEHAVGIEDAKLGIQALRAAGVKAVGVGHYVDEADLLVNSVADLTPEILRSLLAG